MCYNTDTVCDRLGASSEISAYELAPAPTVPTKIFQKNSQTFKTYFYHFLLTFEKHVRFKLNKNEMGKQIIKIVC